MHAFLVFPYRVQFEHATRGNSTVVFCRFMILPILLVVSAVAGSSLGGPNGMYCGTAINFGWKMTCIMDVRNENSTVVFDLLMDGAAHTKFTDPVKYELKADGKFVLDNFNDAFNSYLKALVPLRLPLSASNIVTKYVADGDRLESALAFGLISLTNILTKTKCDFPLLEGPYTAAGSPYSVLVDSTAGLLEITMGAGVVVKTSYVLSHDGLMTLAAPPAEVRIIATTEDRLLFTVGESMTTLTRKA